MLATMRVEVEGSEPKLVFVDLASDKVYSLDGDEVSEELRLSVLSEIRGQQEASIPVLPHEQIYEVINTEKRIQEENNKHIFRRGGS